MSAPTEIEIAIETEEMFARAFACEAYRRERTDDPTARDYHDAATTFCSEAAELREIGRASEARIAAISAM